MTEPQLPNTNLRENATFSDTCDRIQKEAWTTGASFDPTGVLVAFMGMLLGVLSVRLLGRLAHRLHDSVSQKSA